MSNWGCLYLILRANFDGMESETIPEPPPQKGDGNVEYRPGKRVFGVSYDKDKGRITVQYVDVVTGEKNSVGAAMVIAADGVHSSVRKVLQVPTRNDYAGYIGWRGTVLEHLLCQETIEYFSNRLNFTLLKGIYFIRSELSKCPPYTASKLTRRLGSYFIPNETGHMEQGQRRLNWVWYLVVPDGSPEMAAIFTDINGRLHPNTVPQGLIDPKLWIDQVARCESQMIAFLAEVVIKSLYPFVTKVGDAQAWQASFFDNRLVLIGGAFTAFRSHRGMASEQAARNCWQLDRFWRGEITQQQRDHEATMYAEQFVLINRLIGLGGLGHVIAVAKVLWALVPLSLRHTLGYVRVGQTDS
ncbi:MAG: hypothetical protein LQ352_002119 [Teloschistes flavicans]|nr:MAG: hypothetical protein LQ352_002119 [Teloschistes flavicans]